jgi:hypothetical protein
MVESSSCVRRGEIRGDMSGKGGGMITISEVERGV